MASHNVASGQVAMSDPARIIDHGEERTLPTTLATEHPSPDIKVSILSHTGARSLLILTRGKTISHLKASLVTSWPPDFGEVPVEAAQLRLIHAGKILNDAQTLDSLVSAGDMLVMHVSVIPASLVNGAGNGNKTKQEKSGCCVIL